MSLGADEILSLIILLVAIYLFAKAVRHAWHRWKYTSHCEVTKAQLLPTSYKTMTTEHSLMDKKTLRFINSLGKVVTFKTRWIGKGEKGQELHSAGVEIIYNPDKPADIRLNNPLVIWFWPMFLLGVAVLFLMFVLRENINNGALDELISPIIKYAKLDDSKRMYLKHTEIVVKGHERLKRQNHFG